VLRTRGQDIRREGLFSYVRQDSCIPSTHPLRVIRKIADARNLSKAASAALDDRENR
jgi:hypothetical protein